MFANILIACPRFFDKWTRGSHPMQPKRTGLFAFWRTRASKYGNCCRKHYIFILVQFKSGNVLLLLQRLYPSNRFTYCMDFTVGCNQSKIQSSLRSLSFPFLNFNIMYVDDSLWWTCCVHCPFKSQYICYHQPNACNNCSKQADPIVFSITFNFTSVIDFTTPIACEVTTTIVILSIIILFVLRMVMSVAYLINRWLNRLP